MQPAAALLPYAWIPIVLWAALAQTARNAAQRSLVAQAGTLGATLARFLYGLPFAAAWVLMLHALPAASTAVPDFHGGYFAWLLLGAIGQLAATACLLAAMKQRNFVVGVAYSKTDALQVALFAALFLHELPGWVTLASIGWFTAFALTSAANVRTLGMVEVVFSYLVSRRYMQEALSRSEQAGLLLVLAGLAALCAQL